MNLDPDEYVLIGGDFNATFDTDLDCAGGKPVMKDCVKNIKGISQNMN